ncbi:hypothetical protein BGW38_005218, partial [Lunasporangiospora selenospora]
MTLTTAQLVEQADACIKAGRYQELIPLYEQLEFQVTAVEIDAVPLNTVYEPLLASYLIANDLSSARSLVHRIPEDIRKNQAPQLATLIRVYEMMHSWDRQSGNLKDIYSALHQSRWNSALAPLIAVLQDSIQDRELDLLARAYSSLPLQMAASRISLEEGSTAE